MDEPQFSFEKKIGVNEIFLDDVNRLLNVIRRLLVHMKETNQKHKVSCEFFRLDFRQAYFDESLTFPFGSLILDMKWGSKKEIEEKKLEQDTQR
jgi:FAD synthase